MNLGQGLINSNKEKCLTETTSVVFYMLAQNKLNKPYCNMLNCGNNKKFILEGLIKPTNNIRM